MIVKSRTPKLRAAGAGTLVGVALLFAACGSSSSSSAAGTAPASSSASTSTAAATGTAIRTAKGHAGTYLVGPSGRALYVWVADSNGKSSCSGSCAQVWPPVIASGTPVASGGAMTADVGMITRADGAKQVTYKGHPLYYYVSDAGPGTIKGQGSSSFGAKWWLLAPSGTAITSKASASSGGSSSGGSSGGGWG
jgi:predicted lipoprotein with Yx(FWY)xxD motif